MRVEKLLMLFITSAIMVSCSTNNNNTDTGSVAEKQDNGKIKLITVNPGHFHAALVQKSMYDNVDSVVYVFAPKGEDVQEYLKRVQSYNDRPESPTLWREEVYTGEDYFQKINSNSKCWSYTLH